MSCYANPDYITFIKVENGCDKCGYSKFCQCYGFSGQRNLMAGCHEYHESHDICIICGEPHTSTKKKNNMCHDCYDPSIEEKPRYINYHVIDHKRTFLTENHYKCLNCDDEVDPMRGILVCRKDFCTKNLLNFI